MKMVIRRKNKTKFDYRIRILGILTVMILVATFAFVRPGSNKLAKANARLEEQNNVLLNKSEDLSKEYGRYYETIRNNVD